MARARVRTWMSTGCLRGIAARPCECPARCAGPGEPRSGAPAEGKAAPGRQDTATHRSPRGQPGRVSLKVKNQKKGKALGLPLEMSGRGRWTLGCGMAPARAGCEHAQVAQKLMTTLTKKREKRRRR